MTNRFSITHIGLAVMLGLVVVIVILQSKQFRLPGIRGDVKTLPEYCDGQEGEPCECDIGPSGPITGSCTGGTCTGCSDEQPITCGDGDCDASEICDCESDCGPDENWPGSCEVVSSPISSSGCDDDADCGNDGDCMTKPCILSNGSCMRSCNTSTCFDNTCILSASIEICSIDECTGIGSSSGICTADVFQCPDGSFVPRDPNAHCAFLPCPGVSSSTATQSSSVASSNASSVISSSRLSSSVSSSVSSSRLSSSVSSSVSSSRLSSSVSSSVSSSRLSSSVSSSVSSSRLSSSVSSSISSSRLSSSVSSSVSSSIIIVTNPCGGAGSSAGANAEAPFFPIPFIMAEWNFPIPFPYIRSSSSSPCSSSSRSSFSSSVSSSNSSSSVSSSVNSSSSSFYYSSSPSTIIITHTTPPIVQWTYPPVTYYSSVAGYVDPYPAYPTVSYGTCGNGQIEKGEECDDGNVRDMDGCTSLCKHEQKYCIGDDCGKGAYCGDDIVQSALGEQCDDGNRIDNDDCDNACAWVPMPECGDGVVQPETEQCDEGELNADTGNAGCRNNCTLSYCGDGILDSAAEECDGGDNLNGDGCSAVCRIESAAAPLPPAGYVAPAVLVSPTSSAPPQYSGYIPTPAKMPTGPGLVIFLASGAAAGVGLVRRRFLIRR